MTDVAEAMVERVENIQAAFVGEGRHFIHEDQPEMIGRTLADWRRRGTRAGGVGPGG